MIRNNLLTSPTFWLVIIFYLLACDRAHAAADSRLRQLADALESSEPVAACDTYLCSDWTRSVLQTMSHNERKHLAKLLRSQRRGMLREARVEQFRISFRHRDEADSELVVSYPLNNNPADGLRPFLVFSSNVDHLVSVLAKALEKKNLPLVLSMHDPLSPWSDRVAAMNPVQWINQLRFYRALRLTKKVVDERQFKGPYLNPAGVVLQERLGLRLSLDGRWQVS